MLWRNRLRKESDLVDAPAEIEFVEIPLVNSVVREDAARPFELVLANGRRLSFGCEVEGARLADIVRVLEQA